MAGETEACQEDLRSYSLAYSCTTGQQDAVHWVKERYNGLVLSVLRCSMGSPSEMETCVKKLQAFGVRISLEQCRSTIQNTVLRPDIKRYLFFNSRGFGLALAVIFYICVWANLYSTVRMFSFGQSWWSGIAVSLAAALITTVTILVIDCQQREINVNTDVRLAAANESFLKHCVLVGVTDDKQNYSNSLQLWFVHFDPKGCLWYLSQRLDVMKQSQMPALRKCLDHLCIVIETVVDPGPDETEGRVESGAKRLSEEMPLLSKGASARTKPLLYSQIMPLIQEGASEVMAHQLVVVFSACYVRLLVTGQLPEVSVTRHSEKMNAPCLCQFIETTALEDGPFWTKPR